MIIAVTEFFHDHQPTKYFVDTDKLDSNEFLDALILKKCKNKSNRLEIRFNAFGWIDNHDEEFPTISSKAIKKKSNVIDKTLDLTIMFEPE